MADTKVSALTELTGAVDLASYVPIVDGGVSKRVSAQTLLNSLGVYRKSLAADLNNSSVTAAKVTGLDLTLPIGIWQFTYMVRYQAAALTTGVKFDVNFTAATSWFLWNQRWVDVSAAAATAAPDQDEILSTGAVVGAFASRAKGTAGRGVTLSVDTAAADMLMVIEGTFQNTAAGNIELYHGSEVAAQSTVKAGSNLSLIKVG